MMVPVASIVTARIMLGGAQYMWTLAVCWSKWRSYRAYILIGMVIEPHFTTASKVARDLNLPAGYVLVTTN